MTLRKNHRGFVLKSTVLSLSLLAATSSYALEPINVTASADDGNVALNTLDNDLSTRWSAFGDGQYISYELGSQLHQINGLEVAFFRGDERTANIQVQVSDDANNWVTVWNGDQPSETDQLQSIPVNAQGRFLRIVGFGNTSNSWNSITEVEIDASPIADPTNNVGQPLTPLSVTASDNDGNEPENTLDNDLDSRWSAFGDGQSIAYDFGSVRQQFTGVSIAFFRGDQRTANFEIQVSDNANNWSTIWSGDQPEQTLEQQLIEVAGQGRYLRVLGHGNTSNDWNSITEVDVFGSLATNIPELIPEPTPEPTPEETEGPRSGGGSTHWLLLLMLSAITLVRISRKKD